MKWNEWKNKVTDREREQIIEFHMWHIQKTQSKA